MGKNKKKSHQTLQQQAIYGKNFNVNPEDYSSTSSYISKQKQQNLNNNFAQNSYGIQQQFNNDLEYSRLSIKDIYRDQTDKRKNQKFDMANLNQKFLQLQKNVEADQILDSEDFSHYDKGKKLNKDDYDNDDDEYDYKKKTDDSYLSYNSQMCHDQDAHVPDDAEVEQHLDQYVYEDVMNSPLLNRKKQKKLRPQQIQKQQFKEFTQMYRNSNEYREWLEYINDSKANKPSACLTCWQFVSEQQKNMHLAYGHITIEKNVVTSEARFLHYAKLWKKLTWDDIIFIFAPQVGEHFDRRNMQIINMLSHDMKSCRENKGNIKGQPPYLSSPLVPFNMVPPSVSALAIIQRIEHERDLHAIAHQETLAIEEDKEGISFTERQKMKFGEFVKEGYTPENKKALCRILQQMQTDIHYIIKAQDDMLHKLNLMLIKKRKIKYSTPGYAVQTQQEVLGQTIDQERGMNRADIMHKQNNQQQMGSNYYNQQY